jgi:chromosome segregation ATPase
MRQYLRGLTAIRGLLLLLWLALLFLALLSLPAITRAAEPTYQITETVTMSRAQFTELKTRIMTLESLLKELQNQLNLQGNTSTELQQLVTQLQAELKAAKSETESAKSSLTVANQKLQAANQYLTQLSAQIKKERQQAKLAQMRAIMYTVLASVAADRVWLHFS